VNDSLKGVRNKFGGIVGGIN